MNTYTKAYWKKVAAVIIIALTITVTGCSREKEVVMKSISLPVGPETLVKKSTEVIKDLAKSENPYIRTYAMEGLVSIADSSADELIVKALDDDIDAVQAAAAIAAGDRQIKAAVPKLEKLIKSDNIMIKLNAGYALEKMGDRRFLKWYDKAIVSSNEKYAGQSCLLLGKLGDSPFRKNSKEILHEVMDVKGQKPYIRLQAAEALARLGDTSIKTRLLDFAGSGYADDRLLTISALKLLGCTECYAMLSVLASDDQIEVKLSALRALGTLAGKDDREPVYKALDYSDPYNDKTVTERVRHLALLAIGSFGLTQDAAVLGSYLDNQSELIRLTAATASLNWQKARLING